MGLNVPFGLVNAVANTGLDGLPDKLKTQLPVEIDRGQVAHYLISRGHVAHVFSTTYY